jgi:3-deoxy-manno-octulosonate cytidylyltransferase (CMP-KDO synthetase)
MRTVVAIPARLRSSRLPRKMLADLGGCTLLEHTYRVAVRADCGRVVVLTDALEIAATARAFGAEALLTDPDLASGTARIASVVDRLEADVVVNLQGDAPLTDPDVVARSAEEARVSGAPVTMAVYAIASAEDLGDPGVVKVVRAHDGHALYCSRNVVPYVRDVPAEDWVGATAFWAHTGVYAYNRDFLECFFDLPPSALEQTECLEQLRWLQAGVRVHTFAVPPQGPSVDTAADLERARSLLLAGAAR